MDIPGLRKATVLRRSPYFIFRTLILAFACAPSISPALIIDNLVSPIQEWSGIIGFGSTVAAPVVGGFRSTDGYFESDNPDSNLQAEIRDGHFRMSWSEGGLGGYEAFLIYAGPLSSPTRHKGLGDQDWSWVTQFIIHDVNINVSGMTGLNGLFLGVTSGLGTFQYSDSGNSQVVERGYAGDFIFERSAFQVEPHYGPTDWSRVDALRLYVGGDLGSGAGSVSVGRIELVAEPGGLLAVGVGALSLLLLRTRSRANDRN